MRIISIIFILTASSCSTTPKEVVVKTDPPAPIKSKDIHEFSPYLNDDVQKWIDYFLIKDKERFSQFLNQGQYYREVIQTVLEDDELPAILFYLPLIESGYNVKARSHASASGPWQFISQTAKRYGLIVDRMIDERNDPIHSTEAATKYLSDLYNVFNSWELALAAYNCGEMRVLRAIMKGKTRDFWELSQRKLLPRETRNYVPKFLAAAYLGENLEKYNELSVSSDEVYPDVELIEVPAGTHLKTLSNLTGISYPVIRSINPGLKFDKTHIDYAVWVPQEFKEIALAKAKEIRPLPALNTQRNYVVQKGDTLSRIARKLKVSVSKLKRNNALRNSHLKPGQVLTFSSKSYTKVKGDDFYFVKRNESLTSISQRFGISLAYLKKLNGLHRSRLYVGQKLNVSSGRKKFRYVVKKGDNLAKIAKLYRKSLAYIRQKNSLQNNKIIVGQILDI